MAALPFTRADLDVVVSHVAGAWRSGLDGDWSAPAGTVEWSCRETADHAVDAVLAVAMFLASRETKDYPPWLVAPVTLGPDAPPEHLVAAIETVGRVLGAVIADADPSTRAVIWRRPVPATGGPDDFAARGALELVLHGHDVSAGLGIELRPPPDVCGRLREHTRGWPHWTSPGWTEAASTDDPWADLLRASGRTGPVG